MAPKSPPAPSDSACSAGSNESGFSDPAESDCFMAAVLDEARTFVQSVSDAPCPGSALIETAERADYWCLDRNDAAKRVAFMILLKVYGEHLSKREDTMRLLTDLRVMNAKGLLRCIQEFVPRSRIPEHAMLCPRGEWDGIIDFVLDRVPFILDLAFKKRDEIHNPTPLELYLAVSRKNPKWWLDMLTSYREQALAHRERIPELREMVREAAFAPMADDPFPPEVYDLFRREIEAMLDAVENGEICGAVGFSGPPKKMS